MKNTSSNSIDWPWLVLIHCGTTRTPNRSPFRSNFFKDDNCFRVAPSATEKNVLQNSVVVAFVENDFRDSSLRIISQNELACVAALSDVMGIPTATTRSNRAIEDLNYQKRFRLSPVFQLYEIVGSVPADCLLSVARYILCCCFSELQKARKNLNIRKIIGLVRATWITKTPPQYKKFHTRATPKDA